MYIKQKRHLTVFFYNEDSDHQWRLFHLRTWKTQIRDNLDHGWPVIYGASGAYDENNILPAHAFICDGYSNDEKLHFNWGWGIYDGYYPLDSLSPNNHNFNLTSSALFDLRPPEETISFCDISLRLDIFYTMYLASNPDSSVALYDITPRTFNTIESAPQNSASNFRTIPSGATAEYVAHNEIVIQPGFTAEYGSDFTAHIDPCAICEERMVQMDIVDSGSAYIDSSLISPRLFKSGDATILMQPSSLRLYPNPAQDKLTIFGTDNMGKIQLFDQTGKTVFRWYIESCLEGAYTLNIGQIPSGTYIVRYITKEGKVHVGRFVKK